jgi:outer membrane protein OmpA-like peptidoglycan-associated protein
MRCNALQMQQQQRPRPTPGLQWEVVMMKKFLVAVPVLAIVAAGSTACATKKFVRTEVGAVNDKVTGLTTRMEENETRIKANEEKIGQVDGRVTQVDGRVGQVDQKATSAGQSAEAAKTAATAADTKAQQLAEASRKLIYGVVLSEASGGFKFSKAALPDEAKGQLDKMVTDLQADPKAVFFTIEGHTDSTGPATINEQIGLERAEAVKRYLYEQHNVPLHKISVISYGETKPVDSNRTRDGRAKNRRVEVKVSSPEAGAPAATTARTGAF